MRRDRVWLVVVVGVVAVAAWGMRGRGDSQAVPSPSPLVSPTPGESPASIDSLPGVEKWKGRVIPLRLQPEEIARQGRETFLRNCASCHGDEGGGDGPAAVALDPKPRDFRSHALYRYGTADWQVMRTIMEGVPATGMAGWDNRMDERDAWVLVAFLRQWREGAK